MKNILKNKIYTTSECQSKDFEGQTFVSCKFNTINFRFTNFTKCSFQNCDFSGSVFDIASFTDCRFPDTKLSNLDFSGVRIKRCDFSKAIMEGCTFQQYKEGDNMHRKKINLQECNFEQTNLASSIFILAVLEKVSFKGANLERVVFEGCNLTEANLLLADINGTGFNNCVISETYLDIGGFIKYGNSKGFSLKEE